MFFLVWPQVYFVHHLTSWMFEQVNILNDLSYNTIIFSRINLPSRVKFDILIDPWSLWQSATSLSDPSHLSFDLSLPLYESLTQRGVSKVASQQCFGWKRVEMQSS